MCHVFEVSKSGFYEWINRPVSQRQLEDQQLLALIKPYFEEGRGTYGTRTIRHYLRSQGFQVSRKRISRLMVEAGLYCKTKQKFKATTNSDHGKPVAPNLLKRQFNVSEANQAWVGDITYIRTGEGWLYLATVMDLYSRKIVGWSMNSRMTADLVNEALLMAIWQRKPGRGLIMHTDRGSQYVSNSYQAILKDHGICCSMSGKGDCWDNAPAESFFKTLKTELVYHKNYKIREEAKQEIFEYIEVFYNRIRRHTANDYLSPCAYENSQKAA